MTLQGPKGTRDFYPQDFARLSRIFDAWRRVSVRNGFEEFDGPAIEPLELYTAKSGEEIVSQLFRMTDRGGRELALRPELTPSLARMVSQRAASLSLPIKWFAICRLWRAERPQRGRLREFFQWNIDIVGAGETLADAECIYVAIDLLRELGLGPSEVVVKISSRPLLGALLAERGVPEDQMDGMFTVIDKQTKAPPDKFQAMLAEALSRAGSGDAPGLVDEVQGMLRCTDLSALPVRTEHARREQAVLVELFGSLGHLGVRDYCQFELGVVRGLAYYTGPVFEIYDRQSSLRAVAGGGRYDNLLEVLGGPRIPAVGFGMGDVVLAELLQMVGKLPAGMRGLDYFLVDADERYFPEALKLADRLRQKGVAATFSYRRVGVSRQFKLAGQLGARWVVVLGDELGEGRVTVKEMATGRQETVPCDTLLSHPDRPI